MGSLSAARVSSSSSVELFEIIFSIKVYGTASHGDMTQYNNLDFLQSFFYYNGVKSSLFAVRYHNNCIEMAA